MSSVKPTNSKFIESMVVEKTTPRGSRIISIELTSDGRRALTVKAPAQDEK